MKSEKPKSNRNKIAMAAADGKPRPVVPLASTQGPGPVVPLASAPSSGMTEGQAQVAGAGIQAGGQLAGQLLAQEAARRAQQKEIEFMGQQQGLQTQANAQQQLTERQQEALARLMGHFKSALV